MPACPGQVLGKDCSPGPARSPAPAWLGRGHPKLLSCSLSPEVLILSINCGSLEGKLSNQYRERNKESFFPSQRRNGKSRIRHEPISCKSLI